MAQKFLASIGIYKGEITDKFNEGKSTYIGPYIPNGQAKHGRIRTPYYEYVGDVYYEKHIMYIVLQI